MDIRKRYELGMEENDAPPPPRGILRVPGSLAAEAKRPAQNERYSRLKLVRSLPI
jgi:hypothetical protein